MELCATPGGRKPRTSGCRKAHAVSSEEPVVRAEGDFDPGVEEAPHGMVRVTGEAVQHALERKKGA